MSNKKENKYFIKNSKIYSEKIIKFEFYNKNIINDNLDEENDKYKFDYFESKNPIVNNKIILENLKEIKNKIKNDKLKTVEVSKPIEKLELDRIQKELIKKEKLKKIEPDNYKFVEITSVDFIIKQILEDISNNLNNIKIIKEKLKSYFLKFENDEIKIRNELSNEIEIEKKLLDKERTQKDKREEDIKQIEKNINLNLEKIDKLTFSFKNIYKNKNLLDLERLNENKINLNQKISKLKFDIEENQIKIEIIKSKINLINDKIKIGDKKCVNFFILIITLGLIYWTKYSTCKYKKIKLNIKIDKIKSKQLEIKQKILKIKQEIEEIVNKENEFKKISTKENDEIEENKNKINKDISKLTRENESKKKEIDKINKEIKIDDKQIEKIKLKYDELKLKEIELKKNSKEKIEIEIENIKNIFEMKRNEIEQIKNRYKEQKTEISGEYEIQID